MDPDDLLQKPEKVQWCPVRESFFPNSKVPPTFPLRFLQGFLLKETPGVWDILWAYFFVGKLFF